MPAVSNAEDENRREAVQPFDLIFRLANARVRFFWGWMSNFSCPNQGKRELEVLTHFLPLLVS